MAGIMAVSEGVARFEPMVPETAQPSVKHFTTRSKTPKHLGEAFWSIVGIVGPPETLGLLAGQRAAPGRESKGDD